jgi:FkbM family methyltransferase
MRLARIRGHHIWLTPMTNNSVVIDAGAHRGEFSAEIIRRFGCQCHVVEANPDFAETLSLIAARSITIAALSAADGRATFHLSQNPEGSSLFDGDSSTTTIEVEEISLPMLMKRIGVEEIDLLKLDIEGAEFELIASTPDDVLRRIKQITVEFHDFKPQFRDRGLFETARERLNDLGFVCCNMAFRSHGDVLFLSRERIGLRFWRCVYARWIARYVAKMDMLLAGQNG